jgi:HSP20 family protein
MILIVRRRNRRERGKIQQDMEAAFRSLFSGARTTPSGQTGCWRPPVEVYEVEDELIVTVEIAGMTEDMLNVEIDDSVLRIAGTRPVPEGSRRRVFHQTGIPYGDFEAEVFLPFAVALDQVEAHYDNGMLQVQLPRARSTRIVPRGIEAPADTQQEE